MKSLLILGVHQVRGRSFCTVDASLIDEPVEVGDSLTSLASGKKVNVIGQGISIYGGIEGKFRQELARVNSWAVTPRMEAEDVGELCVCSSEDLEERLLDVEITSVDGLPSLPSEIWIPITFDGVGRAPIGVMKIRDAFPNALLRIVVAKNYPLRDLGSVLRVCSPLYRSAVRIDFSRPLPH
jgi:hypothetical protein